MTSSHAAPKGVFLEVAWRRAPTFVPTLPSALTMPRASWSLRLTFALIIAAASARLDPPPPPGHAPTVDPSPHETRNHDEPQPWSHAHAAAHAALCATIGEGLYAPCRIAHSLSPPPPPPNTTAAPAFIYDQLLTANLVLSQTSLVRRGEVLSRAGLVNERNITRPDPRPGDPILVPNANATNVIVQAASGIVQLQGLASTFLAFTPEWAAAKAAFAGVDVEDGAALAEEEDEAQAGIVRRRRRLTSDESAPGMGTGTRFPSPSPSPSPVPVSGDDGSLASGDGESFGFRRRRVSCTWTRPLPTISPSTTRAWWSTFRACYMGSRTVPSTSRRPTPRSRCDAARRPRANCGRWPGRTLLLRRFGRRSRKAFPRTPSTP